MQQILPNFKKGSWGAKVDLKDAYFHVPIHSDLKPFLRHQVGDQVWVYQNGFWHNYHARNFHENHENLSKEVETKKGFQTYIYLDDILIVAPTPTMLQIMWWRIC
jgi:hypothetical protein